MAIAVESLWPRLAPLDAGSRTALGAELSRRFQGLVAAQLLHMDREERRVIGHHVEHMSDVELAAMTPGSSPPSRRRACRPGARCGSALNARERAAMAPRGIAA